MSAETCEAGPFPGPHGSKCFAQANKRKNFGRDPVHQQRDTRGGEENCKAAANRLRKIRRVPAERIQVTPARAQDDRPMRRSKRSTALLQRSGNCLRGCDYRMMAPPCDTNRVTIE